MENKTPFPHTTLTSETSQTYCSVGPDLGRNYVAVIKRKRPAVDSHAQDDC